MVQPVVNVMLNHGIHRIGIGPSLVRAYPQGSRWHCRTHPTRRRLSLGLSRAAPLVLGIVSIECVDANASGCTVVSGTLA